MILLFVYLLISLFFSFLCSLLEAALLSITPSHVSILKQQNSSVAKDLEMFKENIDRPLAGILTLNTFAHTIGAAGVGAQAQLLWGEEYLTLISIILTIIILILTEIIPKTLGANYWKQLTPFTVSTLKVMIVLLWPLVYVSQFITKRLKKDKDKSILNRADFTVMTEIGTQEGVLQQSEAKVIHNILRFNQIMVQHIMTPRTVIKAAPENQTILAFYTNSKNLKFSRIPVYSKTIDEIAAYVLKDEVMQAIISGDGEKKLSDIKRPIEVVVQNAPIPQLFSTMVEKKEHIALVVDEYGGTSGIVSMEDVIETLLGLEITDEFDEIEDLQQWAKEKWQKRQKDLGYE